MNPLELTREQRRHLETERPPVEVVDPATDRTYVLIAREQYERVRDLLAAPAEPAPDPESAADLIPPGILRSQQAFWRDLPDLLKARRTRGKWVCYHGDERVGVARTERELVRECVRRGLPDDEYHTDVIEPRSLAPWEVEEIEPGGRGVDDDPPSGVPA